MRAALGDLCLFLGLLVYFALRGALDYVLWRRARARLDALPPIKPSLDVDPVHLQEWIGAECAVDDHRFGFRLSIWCSAGAVVAAVLYTLLKPLF